MAESTTQSAREYHTDRAEMTNILAERNSQDEAASANEDATARSSALIWTPRFIISFALVLTLGLSSASLLAQGWANHLFTGEWIPFVWSALVFAAWLAIVLQSRSWWTRIGGIFGCCWTLFASVNFVASFFTPSPDVAIRTHATAAASLALFGSYLCLSTNRTVMRRWDRWFLWIAPILCCCIIAASYILLPAATRSAHTLEITLATDVLFLCAFTWWLRPSCWRAQPGPTFFFGLAPCLLLTIPFIYWFSDQSTLFSLQVSFLVFLLGLLRLWQEERR